MLIRVRRRVRELEERLTALEVVGRPVVAEKPTVSHDMPPRPYVESDEVDAQAMWRESASEYAAAVSVPVEDSWGVYL